jgi:hypothetical protein
VQVQGEAKAMKKKPDTDYFIVEPHRAHTVGMAVENVLDMPGFDVPHADRIVCGE